MQSQDKRRERAGIDDNSKPAFNEAAAQARNCGGQPQSVPRGGNLGAVNEAREHPAAGAPPSNTAPAINPAV